MRTPERGEKRYFSYTAAVLMWMLLIALDQLTKAAAAAILREKPFILIPGVFELRYLENKGAAFGMMRNRQWIFIIFAAAIFLFCVCTFLRIADSGRRFVPLRVLSVVLAAGAVGNMIDRIARGFVVDFLYFSLIDFPIFNVADIYVCVSAAVLILMFSFVYSDDELRKVSKRK